MTTFRKLPMQRENRVTVRYRSQGVERNGSREGIRGLIVDVLNYTPPPRRGGDLALASDYGVG
jgi:hypothetical protein